MIPYCDLDLEDSKRDFSHDTLSHDNSSVSSLVTKGSAVHKMVALIQAAKVLALKMNVGAMCLKQINKDDFFMCFMFYCILVVFAHIALY